jgi:hypothetical protein
MLRERNALFTIVKNYDDHSLAAVLPAALLLAVKRAAYASGVPHEAFRPGDGGHSGRPRSTRVGIARRLNRSLVEVVHRLPGGDRLQSFRFVSALAYSRLVAIDELIEHLPQLMRKRHDVQSRRRRTDAEIAPLFGPEALDPADPADNYAPSHRAVLEELGVAAYFSRLLGDT